MQDRGGQTSGDVRNGTERVDGELGCLDGQQRDTYITNVSRTDREGPPDTSIAIPSSGSFDKQSCICNRKGGCREHKITDVKSSRRKFGVGVVNNNHSGLLLSGEGWINFLPLVARIIHVSRG